MDMDHRLDGEIRGIPVDTAALCGTQIGAAAWRPQAGDTALPVLTLDRPDFLANTRAMFAYTRSVGADLAPHAKTPMSPALCGDLMEAGAWGLTVADARQARVLLDAGFERLLLANQIGGIRSGARLGRMLACFPQAELFVFVDSLTSLAAVEAAGREAGRPLGVLIEVGGARGGARTLEEVVAIVLRAAGMPAVRLAGIAAYEGASATADAGETREAITALHSFAREAFILVRRAVPEGELILSSGGSSFFDLVIADLGPFVREDGHARLLLRSGAIFFHDHGVYERGLEAMDARSGFVPAGLGPATEVFRPALRLWAEVLSCPEPGLAICGMGMRDVSFDQGFARPLALWRDGQLIGEGMAARILKLNDQHAFLALPTDADWRVGDIVEFGISHPCTCLDRWSHIFELGEAGTVARVLPTFFG